MGVGTESPVKIRVSKGLDLPISGAPASRVVDGPAIKTVGLVADDYIGMKPTMLVTEGDRVKLGQPVFDDKKTEGVRYTAPAAGKVVAVNRGAKRKFESLVIEVDGEDEETFASYANTNLHSIERDKVKENLVASGLWTAFRTRPFSKIPLPASTPKSIFVTAMDTNPLAIDPALVLEQGENERYFVQGLQVLTALTEGKVFLCKAPNSMIPGSQLDRIAVATFDGPHPAGLPGTHIHFIDPVDASKTVWHIGYQDVVAFGNLFVNGKLSNERIVSLGGPAVKEPRNVRTQLGASIADLTHDSLSSEDVRVISGSVLSGRIGQDPVNFLGRFHSQVSVLDNGGKRELLGWAMPGGNKFSISKAFLSAFSGESRDMPFNTSTQGSKRAIVPIGMYEQVMPLDLIATPLLKAFCVRDTDTAQMLGCLELDEEDLALCTFVCPGKNEYGPMLRDALAHIEKEG